MLMKTDAVYHEAPSQQDELHVTGQFLAKNKLNKRARARLATDILNGRRKIRGLTVTQAARLCRVSVPYINAARRPPARPRESLAQMFARSTSAEKREMARSAGVDLIWDELIQPLI